MSNVIGSKISSARFTYTKRTNSFVTDMSEISHSGADPLGQLYDDAADQGFVMISHKTHEAVEFYLDHTEREADGDIRYWLFKPTAAAVRKNPKLADAKVMIVNT
ncbi:hypothetical protein [Acinetobacter sp.]|uniref:hypothetical protein n=1 Tax=Acinetobacter sp. TaxID=472 RepID=UPI00388E48EA